MNELHICSAAEAEFTDALCWYAKRSIRAANEFSDEVDSAIKAITAEPERFPYCDDCHRHYLLRRFPYQIIFRASPGSLVIVAIAHTSRRPGYWEGR